MSLRTNERPVVSIITKLIDDQKHMDIHKKKLREMKCIVDTKAPETKKYKHLQQNLKGKQHEAELMFEREREHRSLVQRLNFIAANNVFEEEIFGMDKHVPYRPTSLNIAVRKETLRQINSENQALLKRLVDRKKMSELGQEFVKPHPFLPPHLFEEKNRMLLPRLHVEKAGGRIPLGAALVSKSARRSSEDDSQTGASNNFYKMNSARASKNPRLQPLVGCGSEPSSGSESLCGSCESLFKPRPPPSIPPAGSSPKRPTMPTERVSGSTQSLSPRKQNFIKASSSGDKSPEKSSVEPLFRKEVTISHCTVLLTAVLDERSRSVFCLSVEIVPESVKVSLEVTTKQLLDFVSPEDLVAIVKKDPEATSIWVEKIAPYLVLDAARTRLLLNRNPVTWSWTSQASLLVTLPMLMVVEKNAPSEKSRTSSRKSTSPARAQSSNASKFQEGDTVACAYQKGKQWFKATVVEAANNGNFNVLYADGRTELGVEEQYMRRLPVDVVEAVTAPAASAYTFDKSGRLIREPVRDQQSAGSREEEEEYEDEDFDTEDCSSNASTAQLGNNTDK